MSINANFSVLDLKISSPYYPKKVMRCQIVFTLISVAPMGPKETLQDSLALKVIVLFLLWTVPACFTLLQVFRLTRA